MSRLSTSTRILLMHQVTIWELIKVLFSERENKGNSRPLSDDDDGEDMVLDRRDGSFNIDAEASPFVRRAEFSYWLQDSVCHRVQEMSRIRAWDEICQICGEDIEIVEVNGDKEFFVACYECAFPVCRSCYEYERREGDQACPHCKTRYKRHKGSARVEGDEEEDEADDLEYEFNSVWAPNSLLNHPNSLNTNTNLPCLTYGEEIDHDALTVQAHLQESNKVYKPRPMNPSRDISQYGYGSIAWKNRLEKWKRRQLDMLKEGEDKIADKRSETFQGDGMNFEGNEMNEEDTPTMDEARQPLSRKLPIASKKINPYRIIIILRLIILCFFFHYRLLNPVPNAYALWFTSVICEIWFTLSWIFDQLPKWYPIERETFLDRLSLRYDKEKEPCGLADIDIFVTTADPKKEPPLMAANNVLSILAADYPAEKISCYVSDDGAAMLTFEALSETSLFAKKWVPFCKTFNIEPRAPEWYFSQKVDYLKGKIDPAFIRKRRAIKREYEEFKVRINGLVSLSHKVPEEGWTMQDGAPWPGNNARDHPGMVQVFIGHGNSVDENGENLPRLIYVSRERRPGFNYHKKAGAMNALIRVSGVLSNAPYILHLDCSHYMNNSKALREAMCFMMDPALGNKVCFVQFPYKIDANDKQGSYSDRPLFLNINMKGLDGIQGPIYLGTGCVFRRQALYGVDAPIQAKPEKNTYNCKPKWCNLSSSSKRKSRKGLTKKEKMRKEILTQVHSLETISEEVEGVDLEMSSSLLSMEMHEKKYGRSPAFVASVLRENVKISKITSSASALEEALQVISCGYEDKTSWGKEVGWLYGSLADDMLTGFKMHCRGWRSVYCMPKRTAIKKPSPNNNLDNLHQVLRSAMGSVEILLSKNCPIWYGYGGGMKCLQRLSYINLVINPWTAVPLTTYCTLPAFSLLTGKFILPEVSIYSSIIFMTLFASIISTSMLEMQWGRVTLDEWWRSEQFWMISALSSYLLALFRGIIEIVIGVKAKFFLRHKTDSKLHAEKSKYKWTPLLIPPLTLLILNIIGVVSGISNAVNDNYDSWGPLFGKVLLAIWVIIHLFPLMKGIVGKQNRVPTIVVVWSILLASICSLLWVRLNPFVSRFDGPILEVCGLDCE
ncbi:putative cellulose synthase A catalytic subunit 9 [UDP-forming] [Apostasia shenzhenica]|uniref:Cellulose synthase n=1 Tax=Apostasia shenzhenica TaxID=1088818 RepID=A0A2H9ZUN5_9ASPA|nr:putative cellulose synthase A catalytic subunit 9 [UDP-forming] [Apostasia shenzhenica]